MEARERAAGINYAFHMDGAWLLLDRYFSVTPQVSGPYSRWSTPFVCRGQVCPSGFLNETILWRVWLELGRKNWY
jgi:hypothetical protein